MQHRTAILSSITLLVGCGPTREERTTRIADSIVAVADRNGLVLRAIVGGRQLRLMVHDCAVYNLDDPPTPNGRRPAVLETDFYPWPTVCARQAIEADPAGATVTLGKTALGAGGCCATGGTYRTRDGRGWERREPTGEWSVIPRDSAR